MTTRAQEDIPEMCGEEICVGSEETVSVASDEDPHETLSEYGEELEEEGEVRGMPGPRGRADSGALLDMLAEVASQKLLFSPIKRDNRRDSDGKLSSAQVKGMSTNQLIDLFSTTEFDEMRKWYTYYCAFDQECSAKFGSFGNENSAKHSFKQHLFTHIETLTASDNLYLSKRRTSTTRRPRKTKAKYFDVEEAPEVKVEPEEEVQEEVEEEDMKPQMDWGGNFMLPEPQNKVEVEIVGQEPVEPTGGSGAVVDLNRLIAGLSEKMGVVGDHSYSTSEPGVVVYVVEGDSMVLKNGPSVSHQVDVQSESDYNVVRSAELPVIANKRSQSPTSASVLLDPSAIWELSHGENIERDEFRLKRKPKGKAKFIGQSKLEKEQALEAIEAIRMKTGGGLEALMCSICHPPRTFTAPTTLISHYRSHAGIKPYECRVCCAVFTRQHSLNYHMLIHTNQTRFTCPDCGRKFRHPSHFREHRRRHTGESPFECSDCLMRFKTRNTYKRHLRTRHGKVLTTSGGLIILSEDEFQMVRTAPRISGCSSRRGRQRKILLSEKPEDRAIDAIDEDIQALHQLEIVTTNEGYEGYAKEGGMDIEDMPGDLFVEDGGSAAYEEIVKEAVRLERAEAAGSPESPAKEAEETLVIETEAEAPFSGSGLFLATLEDGETVLVNTRDDDSDDASGCVDLGFKLLEVGKVRRNSQQEPTVIVIKNESFS